MERLDDDHLVARVDHGEDRGADRLGHAAGDDDVAVGVEAQPVEFLHRPRDRRSQRRDAPGDRVLVVAAVEGAQVGQVFKVGSAPFTFEEVVLRCQSNNILPVGAQRRLHQAHVEVAGVIGGDDGGTVPGNVLGAFDGDVENAVVKRALQPTQHTLEQALDRSRHSQRRIGIDLLRPGPTWCPEAVVGGHGPHLLRKDLRRRQGPGLRRRQRCGSGGGGGSGFGFGDAGDQQRQRLGALHFFIRGPRQRLGNGLDERRTLTLFDLARCPRHVALDGGEVGTVGYDQAANALSPLSVGHANDHELVDAFHALKLFF